MKLLIAPAHYQLDPSVGSEYTRAFEYISELAKDKEISGDILTGYSPVDHIGNLRIHRLWKSFPRELTLRTKLSFLRWVFLKSRELASQEHYDTLWHLGPFSIGETFNPFSWTLPRGLRFVIGPIYTPFKPRSLKSFGVRLLNKVFLPLSYLTLKKADLVLTIETQGQKILNRLGIKKTQVLPLTIESGRFKQAVPRSLSTTVNILSVGHLVERKKIDLIIRALALLQKKTVTPQYHLTIVGDGPQRKALQALIKELKLQKHVTMVGAVKRETVHTYFKSADIFVSASLAESMPGVYFEAMTSGLPLVITQNDSSVELVRNGLGGAIVDKNDPESIASQILRLTSDRRTYSIACLKNLALMAGPYNFTKNIAQLKSFLHATPRPKRVAKPPRKQSSLIVVVAFIIAVAGIVFGVRGKYGSPVAPALFTSTWKENGPFELSPERGRFALTTALVKDGSVHISSDMARFTTPDVGYQGGHFVSLFAPLLSFLVIPGYLIGEYFSLTQFGTFMNVGVYALLNWILIYQISHRLTSNKIASVIAGSIFLFATPAYAYGVNLYQHHVTVLFLLIGVLLSFGRPTFLKNMTTFFLWALSVSLDYPNAFLFLPLGLTTAMGMVNSTSTPDSVVVSLNWKRALSVIGVVVPILFFAWFNNASYGSPFTMLGSSAIQSVNDVDAQGNPVFVKVAERSEESIKAELETRESKTQLSYFESRDLINGFYIQLFSPDRGIIYFSPVILLGLFGAYFLYKKDSALTALLSSIIVSNLLLYGMWGDPWGGWAFGSRYLIPTYAILSIFIAVFLDHFRRNLLALAIFLSLAGFSLYVSTAGALSTSANPPQVQVLALEQLSGREEKYSYDRNLDFLKFNTSKSFIYQTWAKKYMTSWQYYLVIVSTLSAFVALSTIILYLYRES